MDVLDAALTVGTGGLYGLIGTIGGGILKIFQSKEKRKARAEAFQHEERLLELQMQSDKQNAEAGYKAASLAADMQIKTASYEHDESYGKTTETLAAILRLVRPLLTFYLVTLATYISYQAFTTGQTEMQQNIVNMIFTLTTTAITWWFGDRQVNRRLQA